MQLNAVIFQNFITIPNLGTIHKFSISFAFTIREYMQNLRLTGTWTLENILTPLRASISATSCGVETIKAPKKNKQWLKKNTIKHKFLNLMNISDRASEVRYAFLHFRLSPPGMLVVGQQERKESLGRG